MRSDTEVVTLDFHPVFGLRCQVTTPAAAVDGDYVEMECTADAGFRTIVHTHPEADETWQVLSGTLDLLYQGSWCSLSAGESFSVPRGEVHAFRNAGEQPVRFVNRHTPALGFQDYLESVQRLIQAGKIRSLKDPRSMIHMCMSQNRHRPDHGVKPPQRLVNVLAWIGRRLGYELD